MLRAILSLAAMASLQLMAPAQATITTTDYLITGPAGSGSFSLDFNDATSAYSLSELNFFVGATYDTSNAGMDTFGSDLVIGGAYGGPFLQGANVNDFNFIFDPTAVTQTVGPGLGSGFSLVGFPGTGSTSLTVTQTGANGTITDYSVSGGSASGTFSLDFNTITSAYSLSELNFFVGAIYDTSNAGMDTFGSDLIIGGAYGGPFLQGANVNDFNFIFDPTAVTQTVGPGLGSGFSLVGFPGTGSNELTITQVAAPPPGVPEPSTWAMMLVGFGTVGFAFRRRKQTELTFRRAA